MIKYLKQTFTFVYRINIFILVVDFNKNINNKNLINKVF